MSGSSVCRQGGGLGSGEPSQISAFTAGRTGVLGSRGGLWDQGMHHGGGAWTMRQDLHPAQWAQWVWSGLDDRDHWDEVTGFM